MRDQDYRYLFGISCVGSVLTMCGYLSDCFVNSNIFLLPSVFLYPLLGYWIDSAPCHNYRKDALKYSLTAIVPLCVIVSACLIFAKNMDLSGGFMDAIQCLTPMISFGIFGFMKSMDAGRRHSVRLERAVFVIGDTVFGIYLTEDMIRNQVVKLIVHIRANGFILAVLYTLSTFMLGVAFIAAVKKIPVLKRLT